MAIANINGVNLNYEVTGQGQAVVFLYSIMMGRGQAWANQVQILSPKYKVVMLGIRGSGKLSPPKTEADYSVPIFAEDIFGLLNLLNIKNCCLVGHSHTGLIALQFALSHADKLAGMVLVDIPGMRSGSGSQGDQVRQKSVELARSQGLDAVFEWELSQDPVRIEWYKQHPELREVDRQRTLMASVDGYIYIPRAIARWNPATSKLSKIGVPTLIYWGDRDLRHAEASKFIKKVIAGSEMITLRGIGHSPHEEAPEIFNQALLKFLERLKW